VAACDPRDLAITIILVEEQISGWYTVLRRAKTPVELARAYERLTTLVRSLAAVTVLTFDVKAAARYQELLRLKLNVGRYDLRIAAIVLEQDATLVSRNLRDFERVPGLRVVDWAAPLA
jgi:tRNA(fMet)-specific endonuclease VapC